MGHMVTTTIPYPNPQYCSVAQVLTADHPDNGLSCFPPKETAQRAIIKEHEKERDHKEAAAGCILATKCRKEEKPKETAERAIVKECEKERNDVKRRQ